MFHFSKLLLILIVIQSSLQQAPMHLLIFGGNGFIGSHVSERLLDAGHRLTLVSRAGTFHWNAVDTVQHRINKSYRCDRYNPSTCDEELWHQLDQAASVYDAVIDFSAYRLEAVRPFYERLAKSQRHGEKRMPYVYISTDSVYEVCKMVEETRPLKETDSVRPEDEEERKQLAGRSGEAEYGSRYGDRKLQIEEYLIDQRKNHSGLSYTIIRLPDVLGERDSTQRWPKYQLWLRYGHVVQRPVQIPAFTNKLRTSYVDVKDIALMVELALNQPSKSEDQIFNIGFEEPKHLIELLIDMKKECGAPDGSIDTSSITSDEIVSFFPSVTRGPLDVSNVKTQLGWKQQIEWSDSMKRIATFFLEAEKKYQKEILEIAHSLAHDLRLNDEERNRFIEAIKDGASSSSAPEAKKIKKDEF